MLPYMREFMTQHVSDSQFITSWTEFITFVKTYNSVLDELEQFSM